MGLICKGIVIDVKAGGGGGGKGRGGGIQESLQTGIVGRKRGNM